MVIQTWMTSTGHGAGRWRAVQWRGVAWRGVSAMIAIIMADISSSIFSIIKTKQNKNQFVVFIPSCNVCYTINACILVPRWIFLRSKLECHDSMCEIFSQNVMTVFVRSSVRMS